MKSEKETHEKRSADFIAEIATKKDMCSKLSEERKEFSAKRDALAKAHEVEMRELKEEYHQFWEDVQLYIKMVDDHFLEQERQVERLRNLVGS